MPNGNADFDLAVAQKWFSPIAGVLVAFATRHHLLLDRYYHDCPTWTFRFNHPRGGQASVGLSCHAGPSALIHSSWHVDDYDRFTRFIHWRKPREVSKDEQAVTEELERELSVILAIPLGQWNQVADGYSNIWGRYTKDEFEKMTPSYPDPI